jgi:hypothetical protein
MYLTNCSPVDFVVGIAPQVHVPAVGPLYGRLLKHHVVRKNHLFGKKIKIRKGKEKHKEKDKGRNTRKREMENRKRGRK